ncbi:hypothetical protein IJI76_02755 [Candidatus Saccharibacteria bacterium]|nr:hypothetical protein [Candidatus Saccharibacteria bacterium]
METFIRENSGIINLTVVLVGYVVTFLSARYSFRKELKKIQRQKILEKMEDTPYTLTCILDNVLDAKGGNIERCANDINNIGNKILSYGSRDAIKIYKSLQVSMRDNPKDVFNTMAHLSLLICQLRYDLTSEIISPLDWFSIKIRNISKAQEREIKSDINQIISGLRLKRKFIVS